MGNECPHKGYQKGKGKGRIGAGKKGKQSWPATGDNNSGIWIGTGASGMDTRIGTGVPEQNATTDFNQRKRSRIGAGQVQPDDMSWIGANHASSSTDSGGGSEAPPCNPTISFEQLSDLAQQYMDQQKQAYKDTKELLQRVSGTMLRISMPEHLFTSGPDKLIGAHGTSAGDELTMIADSGAEKHIISGKDFRFVFRRTPLRQPIILETANGETTVTEQGDVICDGVHLKSCLLCETASTSLLSLILLTDSGWDYHQARRGASLKSPLGTEYHLPRTGNLYYLGGNSSTTNSRSPTADHYDGRAAVSRPTRTGSNPPASTAALQQAPALLGDDGFVGTTCPTGNSTGTPAPLAP